MKNYFYNINKKYLEEFSKNVMSRFLDLNFKSNTNFIKSLFKEINILFQKIGGRISSKKDIPTSEDFPDSKLQNKMINNIWMDIDKLFKSQQLIEDDVNNLLNFNSIQRIKTFENMSAVQQKVYSLFTKNQQGISGEQIIEVLFNNSSIISNESVDVKIDEDRGVLTLFNTSIESKNVDFENTTVFFYGNKPKGPLYPVTQNDIEVNFLQIGSHWKRYNKDPHFIDITNSSNMLAYKSMMIDNPNQNTGVGWCEFEAVRTILDPTKDTIEQLLSERQSLIAVGGGFYSSGITAWRRYRRLQEIESTLIKLKQSDLKELKKEISDIINKNENQVYVDYTFSLQSEYAKYGSAFIDNTESTIQQFRLVIPFLNAPITNEIYVSLRSNEESGDEDGGLIPIINWKLSKAWSKGLSYNLVEPSILSDTVFNDGKYICKIVNHIIPDKLELVLEYSSNQWQKIPFYMSHYVYSIQKNYMVNSTVNLTLEKVYDIFVDSEAKKDNEIIRATNVLMNSNRRIA